MTYNNEECCPKFSPEKWDNITHNWVNKLFIKESIPTFFHIPFPPMIGKKAALLTKLKEDARLTEANKEDVLFLFHDTSAFKSEMLLSVTAQVPNANNVNLTGKFFSKVYAGGYNAIPTFIKDMEKHLAAINLKAKDYYIHYAYCPKCAKKVGANYMILFAEV